MIIGAMVIWKLLLYHFYNQTKHGLGKWETVIATCLVTKWSNETTKAIMWMLRVFKLQKSVNKEGKREQFDISNRLFKSVITLPLISQFDLWFYDTY